jgi:PAS domain S-box-containing protein
MLRSHSPSSQSSDSACRFTASQEQVSQWQQEQSILETLSSLSYRAGELKPYLQKIAQGVNQLIGLDWSVVTLCHSGSEQVLASTIDLGEAVEQVYPIHGTLTGTVVKSGAPLAVEDAVAHPEFGRAPEGYRAYLGVPLRTPTGNVIGTICSFQHHPRHFTAEEIRLVNLFAERAATAIDNYQLYQQQQQINQQLQTEIRERQQIEAALRQSEVRFRLLVENAADAFLLINPVNSQIIDANQRACENLGYTHAELLSLSTSDIDVKLNSQQIALFRQQLVAGVPATLESEHRRKDGTTFPVEANICLFESGGRWLELALVRDVTERKRTEQAMAHLAEIGELAAMIVHEVRNPLTTVLMGLMALRGVDLPVKVQRQLGLALEDAERLQRLLNEILLYAKQQVLQCRELELNAFILNLLEPLQTIPAAAERQIRFVSSVPVVWIQADADKLKQVFINLVRNAYEAIKPGDTVTCQICSSTDTHRICISIHNDGESIPPEILAKLGTPFFTTKSSGNGLGLAIVRRIVEAHGGELQIQSAAGVGTTIQILLPTILPGVGVEPAE